MNPLLQTMCKRLNDTGVTYCHWKSTARIENALDGSEDVDLLVTPPDRHRFESIIADLGFQSVRQRWTKSDTIQHYIGLEAQNGLLVHLHVYYRVQTGGNILKNYNLPLERYFTKDTIMAGDMPITTPEKDLAGLVVRRMLAMGSLIECGMLRREGLHELYAEYDALAARGGPQLESTAIDSLCAAMPALPRDVMQSALDAIKNRKGFIICYLRAKRLQRVLAAYAIYPTGAAAFVRTMLFVKKLTLRILYGKIKFHPRRCGIVVAVAGGDATGKSTLTATLAKTLGRHFAVEQHHAGIPPATWLTFIPRCLIPLARRLLPRANTTQIENEIHEKTIIRGWRSYVYAVRGVMIAWDRAALLQRLSRRAARENMIFIVDRYPSQVPGAPDSPQINPLTVEIPPGSWLEAFHRLEKRLYMSVPPAGLVIKLALPLEIALERNATRIKKGNESAEYVTRRHAACALQDFTYCDANTTLDARHTVEAIRLEALKSIWSRL